MLAGFEGQAFYAGCSCWRPVRDHGRHVLGTCVFAERLGQALGVRLRGCGGREPAAWLGEGATAEDAGACARSRPRWVPAGLRGPRPPLSPRICCSSALVATVGWSRSLTPGSLLMAKVPWATATPLSAPRAGALGSAARPRPQGSASPTLSPSQPPSWFSCHVSHHVGAAGSLPGLLGSPVLVPGPPNSYAEA